MENTDLAWAAGFLDGEASFSLSRSRAKPKWGSVNPIYAINVVAAQVDPAPLLKLRAMFGGAIHLHPRRDDRHADYYSLNFGARIAVRMLVQIQPYLVVKQRHAELLLEFDRLMLSQRRGVGDPKALSASKIAQRNELFEIVRDLNKRGVPRGETMARKPQLRLVKRA